jgi:hypothetical protein
MIREAFSYSKETSEDKAVAGLQGRANRSSRQRHFPGCGDLPLSGADEPRHERRHIMVEDNNPDIHDEHDDEQDGSPGNKAVEEPDTEANPPVDEDEEPSPGNSL